ncbi:hypothetical protein R3P38DRAFT_3172259 [Favolaschia claudopus]|uniref:Uncharacterized protein n=1 Tax=Favolaschia claudopus TaxID=2862362 RepID=A0AAW0DKI7_9AGAR
MTSSASDATVVCLPSPVDLLYPPTIWHLSSLLLPSPSPSSTSVVLIRRRIRACQPPHSPSSSLSFPFLATPLALLLPFLSSPSPSSSPPTNTTTHPSTRPSPVHPSVTTTSPSPSPTLPRSPSTSTSPSSPSECPAQISCHHRRRCLGQLKLVIFAPVFCRLYLSSDIYTCSDPSRLDSSLTAAVRHCSPFNVCSIVHANLAVSARSPSDAQRSFTEMKSTQDRSAIPFPPNDVTRMQALVSRFTSPIHIRRVRTLYCNHMPALPILPRYLPMHPCAVPTI